MSEYQVVKFRAIDRPLSDKQLKVMQRQSSRAEFSKWEFEVEYHYSSFRGNVDEMLRNGYDIFLSYSNYGNREIRMRLPSGLPFAKGVWSRYIGGEGLQWTADKTGSAGILTLAPYLDEVDNEVWDFDDYLDGVARLREMLIVGDFRALYLLWLCNAVSPGEEEQASLEPPVPHGLGELPDEAADFLAFFDADPLLVDAAAIGIPKFDAQGRNHDSVKAWVSSIADTRRNEIIQRLLSEDPNAVKAELLSEIRDCQQAMAWPVEPPARTVEQLLKTCEVLRQQKEAAEKKKAVAKAKREADRAEKERQSRMVEMRSAPNQWLRKASKLVEVRSTSNYQEAAKILAELREAIGGERGDTIAREHAVHLANTFPTLSRLKSSLRKCGLLD